MQLGLFPPGPAKLPLLDISGRTNVEVFLPATVNKRQGGSNGVPVS